MIVPSLTVLIGRTGLPGSPSPLAFSGLRVGVTLSIIDYQAPARLALTTYAPDSGDIDGSEAVATAWQQSLLSFDWACLNATSEADVQASYLEVVEALSQFSYPVTTQVSGAPAEVWAADRGSITPSPRTYTNLANLNTVYTVTIPVRPIPGSV